MKWHVPLLVFPFIAAVALGQDRQVVAYWAQNDNSLPGGGFGFISTAFPQPADVGIGQLSVGGGLFSETEVNSNGDEVFTWIESFAGFAANAQDGFPAGGSISPQGGTDNGNNGGYFDFTFSMTGLTDLQVSYDTRGTGGGFTTHEWSYSTDGTDFVFLETFTGRNVTSWSTLELEPSLLTVLDNVETVFLRLTFDGATGATGNNRLDNITLTAIPEPSTYALIFGAVLLAGVLARRRYLANR